MYEKEKQELIKCGMEMLRYGLVSLTGGNVSLRLDDGTFLDTIIRQNRRMGELIESLLKL